MKKCDTVKLLMFITTISVSYILFPEIGNAAATLQYDSYIWAQITGNGDSTINPGENIKVNVKIKNTGTSGTDGVYAWLTTSDSYVSYYNSYGFTSGYGATYGTIGASSSQNATGGGYYDSGYSGYIRIDFNQDTPADHLVTFTLNIKDTYGNTWTDTFLINVGPPIAPSNLKGIAQSQTSILWSWTDNSNDETGFQICDDGNNVIVSLGANTNSGLDQNLRRNTRYTRYVKAYNSAGDRNSNVVSVYTLTASPTNLFANGSLIESCVALYWSGNDGSRFLIEKALDSNGSPGTWQVIKSWNDNILSENFIDTNLSGNTKYWYRVKSYNGDGIINDTPSNEVSVVTLPGKPVTAPKVEAFNNLIDPTKNQTVYISCSLPQDDYVSVTIYDISGREIKKIIDNEKKPAGVNIIEWSGKNIDNEIVASGSYIILIKAGSFVEKKKVLVIK